MIQFDPAARVFSTPAKMAPSIHNFAYFYTGKYQQRFGSPSMEEKLVYALLSSLTLLGAYFFTIWLISFVRFLLSVYVLPGKPV